MSYLLKMISFFNKYYFQPGKYSTGSLALEQSSRILALGTKISPRESEVLALIQEEVGVALRKSGTDPASAWACNVYCCFKIFEYEMLLQEIEKLAKKREIISANPGKWKNFVEGSVK